MVVKLAGLAHQEAPLAFAVERGHQRGCLAVFFRGGTVGELQVVDAGLVGQQLRLAAARLLAQRTGGRAAAVEHGAGTVEVALVDQRQRLRADRRELGPLVAQARKLGAQLDQLVGRGLEAGGDLLVRHAHLAELGKDSLQRRDRNALLARDAGELLVQQPPDALLVETYIDGAVADVAIGRHAAVVGMDDFGELLAQPAEHRG